MTSDPTPNDAGATSADALERARLAKLVALLRHDRQLTAFEIHDGALQDFTAASMFLESARHLAEQEDVTERLRRRLAEAHDSLRKGAAELRRTMEGLRPAALEEGGIVEAVKGLLRQTEQRSDVKAKFACQSEVEPLPSMEESALYRIVQEALSNVAQHSRAGSVEVTLNRQGRSLSLIVQDDGRGFDPDQIDDKRFGLRGIRERAAMFGGAAVIESAPGQGARVEVTMPIVTSDEATLEP